MWPVHELATAIKGDRSACDERQVFDRFDDLSHHRFGASVRVLQNDGKAAYTFNQSCDICLAKLLFKQYEITFPCVDALFDARDSFNSLYM